MTAIGIDPSVVVSCILFGGLINQLMATIGIDPSVVISCILFVGSINQVMATYWE